MKATVVISKDADFSQNPVGFVDVNPIPDAARDGLQVALLTTSSKKAATLDRASGKFLDVSAELGSDVEFDKDGVKLMNRQHGYIAEKWPDINYSGGFTVICVYDSDIEFDGSTGSPVLASLDGGTNLPFQIESRGFRIAVRAGEAIFMVTNEANTYAADARRSISRSSGLVFAGFSYHPALGQNGQAITQIPVREATTIKTDLEPKGSGPAASPSAGVSILKEPRAEDSDSTPRDRKVAFIAQYDRPMKQDEIDDLHSILRPWLSSVGVEVE